MIIIDANILRITLIIILPELPAPESVNIQGILIFPFTELYVWSCRRCEKDAWMVRRLLIASFVCLIVRPKKCLTSTSSVVEAPHSYLQNQQISMES